MDRGDGRRVLVTGATGTLGRRLIPSLPGRVNDLVVLGRGPVSRFADLDGVDWIQGDLVSGEGVDRACRGVDTVIHLASYSPQPGDPEPEEHPAHFDVTVTGTARLLASARHAGVERLVFVSSVRAQRAATAYGRAKREAEEMLLSAAGSGPACTLLRLPALYGPGVHGNIARLIALVHSGRCPPLPETGNRRSLLHLDDAVAAVVRTALGPLLPARLYGVSDGEAYSGRRIYAAITTALGRRVPRWTVPAWLLRAGAACGDLVQRGTGLQLPLNSGNLEKLLGSEWIDGAPFVRDSGFDPHYTLESALPDLVADRLGRTPQGL